MGHTTLAHTDKPHLIWVYECLRSFRHAYLKTTRGVGALSRPPAGKELAGAGAEPSPPPGAGGGGALRRRSATPHTMFIASDPGLAGHRHPRLADRGREKPRRSESDPGCALRFEGAQRNAIELAQGRFVRRNREFCVGSARARASSSPMFRARDVGRSVRFVRGEEEV